MFPGGPAIPARPSHMRYDLPANPEAICPLSSEEDLLLPSRARREHLVDHALERVVLQRSGHPLFVGQLLVDLVVLGMGAFLHGDINPVVGRQGPLQTYPDGKADDGRQRAVGDGGRNLDEHCVQRVRGRPC